MSDVIDLGAFRDRRDGPDPDLVATDEYGRKLFTYLLSYDFDGGQYSTQVWAYSMEDAAARVEAMRASLRLDGQAFHRVPV